MAKFNAEIPNELLKEFEALTNSSDNMISEMVEAGSNIIYDNIQSNINKSFRTTKSLQKGLKKAKPKQLKNKDGYGGWVGFDGYTEDGTPIPLIAMAREYGTSKGETKKPFLRKSVNKNQIESAMQEVQNKYIKEK